MEEKPKTFWEKCVAEPRRFFLWLAITPLVLLGIGFLAEALHLQISPHPRLQALMVFGMVFLACGFLVGFFGFFLALIPPLQPLMRWVVRRSAFLAACAITLVALFYTEENWRGKRAWEQHKRVWEAKGEKFTVAELAPPPVPDEQNFALTPLLKPTLQFTYKNGPIVWLDTNGLARLERLRADLRPDRRTNDNLVLGDFEKNTFVNLTACREFYRGNTNYPQPAVPQTPAEDILLALGKFNPELGELREAAATRPRTRFPITYDYQPTWAILLPHLAHLKGIAMVTMVRATAELELKRTDEAWADLKLGLRIADSMSDEPILVDHLVRLSAMTVNLQTMREGLVRHAWSEAQLVELEKYLASVNLLAEYKLAMRGERALSTDGLDYLRRQGFGANAFEYLSEDGGGATAPASSLVPSGWFRQNMLTISEMHQEFTLTAADENARRVFPEICDRMKTAVEKMRAGPYTFFARMLVPALNNAVRRSARRQTAVDCARIACALERHRMANGTLPETLEVLVPRFMEKIPTDLFDGKPLHYRRETDGYALYSLGWNQVDDGGQIALTKGSDPGANLAKGDWVWQMPVR